MNPNNTISNEAMLGNTIPNEEIVRLAEKEEVRFLGILLKDKDCISDAISYGIEPTKRDMPGHFLDTKNSYFYELIKENYMNYGSILTRSAVDSLMDMQEGGTDEQRSSMKTLWDKIWNRHDVDREDYSMLRDHINDRYLIWQFFEIWKHGGQILKATTNHTDLVKGFINDINSLKNLDPDAYSLTMSIDEGIPLAMEHIAERRENPADPDRIKTDIKGIDDI